MCPNGLGKSTDGVRERMASRLLRSLRSLEDRLPHRGGATLARVSIWIRAVSRMNLSEVTPELLYEGIASRLAGLAALYCPDDEESSAQVLSRLHVERADNE